jgi:hypothetical protein
MSRGLSDFVDAITAWLCFVSVAIARKPLLMPSILLPLTGSSELRRISGKTVRLHT